MSDRHLTIEKRFTFEAEHQLPNVPAGHPCGRVHGHSYGVTVVVQGEVSQPQGWIVDFAEIRDQVQPLLDRLEHRLLNDIEGLENPTSEHLVGWLADHLEGKLPGLCRIRISETLTSCCEVLLS